jgi:hypothetical protein
VRQQHPHRDAALSLLGELRPVPRYRGFEVHEARLDLPEQGDRAHRLSYGPTGHDGVALPRLRAGGISMPRPEVHDRDAVEHDRDSGPYVAALREVAGELVADALEAGGAVAVDRRHHSFACLSKRDR